MDRDSWEAELRLAEGELGFAKGFKFVYGPWATLEQAEVAFLSLNPGRARDGAATRMISDERGNSYQVERSTGRSPIRHQFLRLADLLGIRPCDILTGVVAPFRSDRWEDLTDRQRREALNLGRRFWEVPLNRPELRLIVACSKEAAQLVVEVTKASFVDKQPAGWGSYSIRRYCGQPDKKVVHLPHLSRFKLLGREPSEGLVLKAVRGNWPKPRIQERRGTN